MSGFQSYFIIATACLCASWMSAQIPSTSGTTGKGTPLTAHARGPFEVKVIPQEDESSEALFGRVMLEKQFHGDLEATSKGEMLSAGTGSKGSSGAYVALERVTGTLQGRSGSFTLVHIGIMDHGVPQMTITVVPDSGTAQFEGMNGKMNIKIEEGGKHFYDLDYTLPSGR